MTVFTGEAPPRPELPAAARPLFDQIFSGEFLGASRNIRQINNLFCEIVEAGALDSGPELATLLVATGAYISATRGRNTPAIGNAVQLMLHDLDQAAASVASLRDLILTRREENNARSLRNADLMAEHGANLFLDAEIILAFDYSSSQLAILKRLAERGRKIRVVVPESRCLDGGRPIAREASAWGHQIDFVVDLAFGHFLRRCDGVLIGAETILANGDCWNTVGSYVMAEMAQIFRVPYYVATELIKIDPQSFAGYRKPIKPLDYELILNNLERPFEHPSRISYIAPDLDTVPAALITGYITPRGVIPAAQLWSETERFLAAIGIQLGET